MMAENVTLKDLVAEQNETQNLLRQQLADLTETLQTLQGSNSNSVLVCDRLFLFHLLFPLF
jgi:uncharacterized coiled-coil protein SlyX